MIRKSLNGNLHLISIKTVWQDWSRLDSIKKMIRIGYTDNYRPETTMGVSKLICLVTPLVDVFSSNVMILLENQRMHVQNLNAVNRWR